MVMDLSERMGFGAIHPPEEGSIPAQDPEAIHRGELKDR